MNNSQITIERIIHYKKQGKWVMEYFHVVNAAGSGEELEITHSQAQEIISNCGMTIREINDGESVYEKLTYSIEVKNTNPANSPPVVLGSGIPANGMAFQGTIEIDGFVIGAEDGEILDGNHRYNAIVEQVSKGNYEFAKTLHKIREAGKQICVFGELRTEDGEEHSHAQYMVKNDGGRAEAGFKGRTGDCVTRAIAIVTQKPYKEVYNALNELSKKERIGKRKKKISNSRTGVYRSSYEKYMLSLGMVWTPLVKVGQKERAHLRGDELPKGRIVVSCTRHLVAMIDGVVHDTHDPCRGGTRTAYGYYSFPNETEGGQNER